ncbi:MAG: PocR ligand-binding domain-containing protein [bacterium]
MKPTDLAPLEFWKELLGKLHRLTGLTTLLYDSGNKSLYPPESFANELCKLIMSSPSTSSAICGLAHQVIATMAKKSCQPQVQECDLGMIKMVVPIFKKGEFFGAVGACGLLPEEEGEVDTFLAAKNLGCQEAEIEQLTAGIKILPDDKIEAALEFILRELEGIGAESGK